jgi:multiple sugar transport system permease protein
MSVTAIKSRSGRRQGHAVWPARTGSHLFMVAFLLYFILPLIWLFISATKTNGELFASFGLWFAGGFHLLNNIRELFAYQGGIYWRWLANTAVYSVISASLFAAAGGYAFARYRFRGRELLFGTILGTIMVPSTALVIPLYLLFSKIGLTNTPLAIILPSLVSPFGLYLMRMYADQAVPDELLDAARMDGAGEFRIFRRIAFRLMTPGFVTVLLFSFVATWNNYFLPLVMLGNSAYYPITVGLANMNAQASAGGGAQVLVTVVITGALIAIVPLIVAFLFLQRYWRGGLAVGSQR